MQRYKINLDFSFGEVTVWVNLTGRYADMGDRSNDRLRLAVVVNLLHLIQWREAVIDNDPRSSSGTTSRNLSATSTTSRHKDFDTGAATDDVIEVQLAVEDKEGQIRKETLQMVTDTIATSLRNSADSEIFDTGPLSKHVFSMLTYTEGIPIVSPRAPAPEELHIDTQTYLQSDLWRP